MIYNDVALTHSMKLNVVFYRHAYMMKDCRSICVSRLERGCARFLATQVQADSEIDVFLQAEVVVF